MTTYLQLKHDNIVEKKNYHVEFRISNISTFHFEINIWQDFYNKVSTLPYFKDI